MLPTIAEFCGVAEPKTLPLDGRSLVPLLTGRADIKEIEKKLGMRISMDETPLDAPAAVARFIDEVKQSQPDGPGRVYVAYARWGDGVPVPDIAHQPSLAFIPYLVTGDHYFMDEMGRAKKNAS